MRIVAKDGIATLDRCGSGDSLPFVPAVGMKLSFDEDADAEELEITDVTWCVPQDCFWITLEDDVMTNSECPCDPKDHCCVLESAIPYWTDKGWECQSKMMYADFPELFKEQLEKFTNGKKLAEAV